MANPRPFGVATRFQKGRSGNPSGKPAGAKIVASMIASRTRGGEEIVEEVLKIARRDEEYRDFGEKSVCWALDWLGKRLWGSAPLAVETEQAERPAIKGKLSVEELRIVSKLDVSGVEVTMDDAADGTGEAEEDDSDDAVMPPEPGNGDGPSGPN